MARENITNFALTTLSGAIAATDTNFTVATGTGNAFPAVSTAPAAGAVGTLPYTPRSFIVSIDSELMLVSSRSADSFTVSQRGYEGTTAAAHASGASVTLAITKSMMDRLWASVADTHNIDIPPFDRLVSPTGPNGYDDDFESQASAWTVYPNTTNLGGTDAGATLTFGTTYRSNLYFSRAASSAGTYWIYKPITISAATAITWKWSHGVSLVGPQDMSSLSAIARMFVSDQANPTSALWSGNGLYLGLNYDQSGLAFFQQSALNDTKLITPVFQAAHSVSNAYTLLSYTPFLGEMYGAITFDGSSGWTYWIGNGYVWRAIAYVSKTFTPRTIGFRFEVSNATGLTTNQKAMIDWLRVGSSL